MLALQARPNKIPSRGCLNRIARGITQKALLLPDRKSYIQQCKILFHEIHVKGKDEQGFVGIQANNGIDGTNTELLVLSGQQETMLHHVAARLSCEGVILHLRCDDALR